MKKRETSPQRPPLRHLLNGPLLDAGFAFFHGARQSSPQRVALESERFLLFPPQHYSNKLRFLCMWVRWGEEYFQSRLQATSCWGLGLSAPKGFAGKRKSGSRYAARARLRFCCQRIPSPLSRTPQVATSGNILLCRN
ncbi:hypothetical protein B5G50_29730 [Brevibacillus brevis]|nr:hypothetical protein B5G50_29730 [Brevibacillus brevis]